MNKVASDPKKVVSALTTQPPERIHGWQRTQMSIASYYGGLTYQGAAYTIAFNEPGQPLVRVDVMAREVKAAKAARSEETKRATQAQGDLM